MATPFFRVSTWDDDLRQGSYAINPRSQWTTSLKPPYLLMIHGYNQTYEQAERKFVPVAERFPEWTRIGFYWKNTKLYEYSRMLARRSARALKTFLIRNFTLSEARQLTIVAHSMGCRLALRALTELYQDASAPTLRPKNLILWSAAVDDEQICRGDDYFDGTRLPSHVRVMYSKRDTVLKKLFPVGDLSHALGYHGPDLGEAPVGRNVTSLDCTSYIDEHSRWWTSERALNDLQRRVTL